MIVEQKIRYEKDGTIGYIESTFDSSNILASIYFPKTQLLYISFKRGGVYSYIHVDNKLHEGFQHAESQGKFFNVEIRKKEGQYPHSKEFTLYKSEIEEKLNVINEWKENQQ